MYQVCEGFRSTTIGLLDKVSVLSLFGNKDRRALRYTPITFSLIFTDLLTIYNRMKFIEFIDFLVRLADQTIQFEENVSNELHHKLDVALVSYLELIGEQKVEFEDDDDYYTDD